MDRATVYRQRGFLDDFGECWVSVAATCDIFTAGTEFHGYSRFRDQVPRTRTKNVDAQYTIGLGVGEHLDVTVDGIQASCSAIGTELEDA